MLSGVPLCYSTLLCVLKLVSRAFLKILNESICGGTITRNWYNLEVFIPTLGEKTGAENRGDTSASHLCKQL